MTVTPKPTRVFVAARFRFVRDHLADVVDACPDMCVVGAAGLEPDLAELVAVNGADVALIELAMPRGVHGALSLLRSPDGPRVLALGSGPSESDLIPILESGMSGWISPDDSVADIERAVRTVARRELVCSPALAHRLACRLAELAADHQAAAGDTARASLTRRELQIVELIAQGLTNKQIASELTIEIATVKNHVHHALEKLGVERRTQAAELIRRGVPRRVTHVELRQAATSVVAT